VLEDGRTDGKRWQEIMAERAGVHELPDEDMKAKRLQLSSHIKRPATDEELCIYSQFPRDALDFIKFEERFGQTWLLPPDVWFHEGGFADGSRITFPDKAGKVHNIDIISTRRTGESVQTSFLVDYRFQTYTTHVSKNRAK
jgi:pyruvate carboxylase